MFAVLLSALLFSGSAAAKASHDSPYTYQQTFGTALRLLKVDLGHEVTELNAEWGYILFVYVDSESGKRKNRGAITFVKSEDDQETTVSVEIPQMPSYHEELMLQKLRHKLQKEHGEPPAPPKKPTKDEDDDEDDDKDGKKDDDEGDDGKKKREKKKRGRSRKSRRK